MRVPFRERAAGGDDKAGFCGGIFESLALPWIERALHRVAIVLAAEQRQQAATMMRQVGVQPHPTAVAAAIKSGEIVVIFGRHLAVDTQIALAAKFDGRGPHVDGNPLPPAGAQPPKFAGCQSRRGDGRLRGGADRERGRQHRLCASKLDAAQCHLVLLSQTPQTGEDVCGIATRHSIPMGETYAIEIRWSAQRKAR